MGSSNKQKQLTPLFEDPTKQFIHKDCAPVPRIIVCSACYNRKHDILILGARHWDKTMISQLDKIDPYKELNSSEFEQGFIDQYGQFIDRKKAKHIAITNQQKLVGDDWGNELFSENLY